jgi:ElaB/YqjD/DUF883 family membrane-anchored ribosome-binding protein
MASKTMTKDKSNGKIDKKVHSEINKHLNEGKNKLMWLEKQVAEKKQKLASMKKRFDEYEEKAEQYVQKNPKKALAMAVAAGVLVTAVASSFRSSKK